MTLNSDLLPDLASFVTSALGSSVGVVLLLLVDRVFRGAENSRRLNLDKQVAEEEFALKAFRAIGEENDRLRQDLRLRVDALEAELIVVRREVQDSRAEREELHREYQALRSAHEILLHEHTQLKEAHAALMVEYASLREQHAELLVLVRRGVHDDPPAA